MTHLFAAARTGLCPEPRDFVRHENNPKKPEKEKAEADSSSLFGLLPGYSLNGCVPALPFSALSGSIPYSLREKKSRKFKKKSGLPSVFTGSILVAPPKNNNELEAQKRQEASHE